MILYYLATCSTCARIMKELKVNKYNFQLQDIKTSPITATQLDAMKKLAGSYEALFSRRAIKYKEMGLKDQVLQEKDFQRLILQEYTFLKRPVIIYGDKIFVGNEEKTVAAAEQAILKAK